MRKIVRVLSVIVAPLIFVCAFLTGCKKGKQVEVDTGDIMQDIEIPPKQTPDYEQYSKQALADYFEVANKHIVEGEVDSANPEVINAARQAAAKLYAYACYNERTLDQYVWFSDQMGGTDLGSAVGSADVKKQDYYLKVCENEEHCGYRCYITYKWAVESYGLVSNFKSSFEAARLRITEDTDILYRFVGDTKTMRIESYNESLGCDMIGCDWATKPDEWGVKDIPMVKEEFIAPEDIEADIIKQADDYYNDVNWTVSIHGNINILAENIVKYAMILEDDDEESYTILMNIDTDVANKDKASVQMLTKLNGTSGDCQWKGSIDPDDPDVTGFAEDTGLKIIFRIWKNGLFRSYSIIERWTGKIVGFSGTAESNIVVNYSYSDRDCDMTANLEMLEEAKRAVNNAN